MNIAHTCANSKFCMDYEKKKILNVRMTIRLIVRTVQKDCFIAVYNVSRLSTLDFVSAE